MHFLKAKQVFRKCIFFALSNSQHKRYIGKKKHLESPPIEGYQILDRLFFSDTSYWNYQPTVGKRSRLASMSDQHDEPEFVRNRQ